MLAQALVGKIVCNRYQVCVQIVFQWAASRGAGPATEKLGRFFGAQTEPGLAEMAGSQSGKELPDNNLVTPTGFEPVLQA